MPDDARRSKTFLLAAIGWSVGLFALFRAPAVEQRLVLPMTRLQQRAAEHYAGAPSAPINVTLECSGTDVLALCLAAVLACPVGWRSRLAGLAGAIALILGLNTARIASLGRAAASPELFAALHLQVWPAILSLAAAAYVLLWMRASLGPRQGDEPTESDLSSLARRFAPRAAVLLVLFALCGPLIARSEWLVAAGGAVVAAAGLVLRGLGVFAVATGNILSTSRGSFIVTPDCLATALVPVYAAGILTARRSARWRATALAAGVPLFVALALVRLLLLALPPALATSPLFLVHGFHQLVLGIAAVALLAAWRESEGAGRGARAARRAAIAIAAAAAFALVLGDALSEGVVRAAAAIASVASHTLAGLTNPGDAQGALALLPVYQACLLVALGIAASVRWRRLAAAGAVLLASQVMLLVLLAEAADHANVVVHALALRGWAVAFPVLLVIAMVRSATPAQGTPLPLPAVANGSH